MILERKLIFIHHLKNLPESSLARTIFEEQVRKPLGLYQEVKEHLACIRVNDLQSVSKWQYKKAVKKYVMELNKTQLLDDIRKYKKLSYDNLSQETFERKPYFLNLSLESARMRFRVASKLVPTILANFASKYRRRGQSLACPSCSAPHHATSSDGEERNQPLHSQSHILTDCAAVSDLRAECEPRDDFSLAEFFKKVVARNMEIEDFYS